MMASRSPWQYVTGPAPGGRRPRKTTERDGYAKTGFAGCLRNEIGFGDSCALGHALLTGE